MKQATVWVGIGGVIIGTGLGYLINSTLQHRSQSADPVYAVVNGEAIRASQVHVSIQGDLDELEKNQYRLKRKATEDLILESLKKNSSPKSATASANEVELSREEISQYFKSRNLNPQKMARVEYDRQLNILRYEKYQKNESQEISERLKNARIEWKLKLPPEKEYHLGEGALPARGSQKAPVELVFISNFHCPFCGEAEKRLREIQDRYKDQVRLRFLFSFNEPDSSLARASAEAAHCAQEQEQFWKYRDYVAEHPVTERKGLIEAAEATGLKTSEFENCLTQRKKRQSVIEDLRLVSEASLPPQVPAFLINGKWRAAHLPLTELSPVIDQEIGP